MRFLLLFIFIHASWATDCLKELSSFEPSKSDYIRHAQNFKVYEFGGKYSLLAIKGGDEYLLAQDFNQIKNLCPGTTKFQVPLKRIVVTSTTHLPPFEMLNAAEHLVGITNPKLVSSPKVVTQIKAGKISDTGFPLNAERIISLKPDLIVTYVAESKELEGVKALEKFGLPVVLNLDFMERNPLARAEWIKFFGLFLAKKQEAGQIFTQIESRYTSLQMLVKKVKAPLVIAGKNSSEIWYAPGARSDFAMLLRDAGGRYLWEKDQSRERITRNIEEVFSHISKVAFWFPQNDWKSLRDVLREDSRYRNFVLLKASYVFNFNKKVNKMGGNDYWETAMMRPDLLLADLIYILHPELLPDHKLIWYQQLK